MRVRAVREAMAHMSLNKAMAYCGMSKRAWYYARWPRDLPIGADAARLVRQVATRRPTYWTRRMAAQMARETGVPTNRKKIQRIYRKIGWIEPQKNKKEIIRASRRRRFKPSGSNQLWETDITYIHCVVDGWRYCFNVLDVYIRRWVAYVFDTTAMAGTVVQSILKAVTSIDGNVQNLRISTDNGPQYDSREFRKAMQALGLKHEFVWKNTPE